MTLTSAEIAYLQTQRLGRPRMAGRAGKLSQLSPAPASAQTVPRAPTMSTNDAVSLPGHGDPARAGSARLPVAVQDRGAQYRC